MQSPSPPPPPDPKATAAAQTGMNKDTAITTQLVNMIDQYTPQGSTTYTQDGFNSFTDSDGKTVNIPKFVSTVKYSPEQQALYDLTNKTSQNLGQIGVDQSAKIGALLKEPININNEATEARLMDLGRKRLDPRFAENEEALRTRLVNSGIRQGTEAWDREFRNFNEGKNDAYNELVLRGRSQAVQEALTERNQPINEISALLSGSQVSQPTFGNTPTAGVAGVDYTGAVQNKYNNDMNVYNQKVGANNAMMGGLFGLASAPFKFSDRRVKTDIKRVGSLDNGLPVYLYRYKGQSTPEIGLMAQDVERVNPSAVIEISGIKAVNYAAAVE